MRFRCTRWLDTNANGTDAMIASQKQRLTWRALFIELPQAFQFQQPSPCLRMGYIETPSPALRLFANLKDLISRDISEGLLDSAGPMDDHALDQGGFSKSEVNPPIA